MIKYECDMCGNQSEDMKKFSYVRFLEGKKTFLLCRRCENNRMDLANQAKQSEFVANFEEREKVEQRKEMRSILEELIIRSKDGLKADLLELKEKYSNFDVEEKK